MTRITTLLLLVSLFFVGLFLQPFDAAHPLSVTRECVQSLPACGGGLAMLAGVIVLFCLWRGLADWQQPALVFPQDVYHLDDPERGSPILVALRRGRLARRFYN